ncbi:hypothetical protein ARMSODRAFT_368632 [Armillaria solidipes]|uniref:Uncharacterized protein n=1 Tax=Armillaria solidipes TaxID=1076256 RepID=A0A2H3BNE2_9AGAR|nr:hypothetical protein ARMSODRAFT_368632 [Armillaria solidipes]
MSACNHAVFSARSTIGSLFASKDTIGLGIIFPFNFSSQEEARIAIVASPSMSRSRAKFWLDSSSPIFHPSISTSYSKHLSQTTKSEPYKDFSSNRLSSNRQAHSSYPYFEMRRCLRHQCFHYGIQRKTCLHQRFRFHFQAIQWIGPWRPSYEK